MMLDESQGLTVEMVRDWLQRDGYKLQVSDEVGEVWDCAVGLPVVVYKNGDDLLGSVERIAENAHRSLQALLRDMNPRMCKGLPSEAARDAHRANGGMWIGSYGTFGDGGFIVFVGFRDDDDDSTQESLLAVWDDTDEWHNSDWQPEQINNYWSFWPCDAHGNKLRWPERDGVML